MAPPQDSQHPADCIDPVTESTSTPFLTLDLQMAVLQKAKGSARKITADEVAEHDSMDNRVWVTHKGGVYDITNFIEQHPGGAARIMLAAGGSVDSFWCAP